MELTVEPTSGVLPPFSRLSQDAMAGNSSISADGDRYGVDKRNPSTTPLFSQTACS